MKTVRLDQIVRQQNPELRAAVEHLARGEMATGIELLQSQGRIREIADPAKRIQMIAEEYAASPDADVDRLPRQRFASSVKRRCPSEVAGTRRGWD